MQYANKTAHPTIYSLMESDIGFRKLFYSYVFGIMADNHLEYNDYDFEMFKIIFISTMGIIQNYYTADLIDKYEEDIRGIYFAYFKVRTIANVGQDGIDKITTRIRTEITDFDLSPTDADFENCIEMVKTDMPRVNNHDTWDVIVYKMEYFRDCYYNIIRILHQAKGGN